MQMISRWHLYLISDLPRPEMLTSTNLYSFYEAKGLRLPREVSEELAVVAGHEVDQKGYICGGRFSLNGGRAFVLPAHGRDIVGDGDQVMIVNYMSRVLLGNDITFTNMCVWIFMLLSFQFPKMVQLAMSLWPH